MVTRRHVLRSDPAEYERLPDLLRTTVADGAPWMDTRQMARLLLAVHELVVNIGRHAYAGSGGSIRLTVSASTDSVVVSAVDTGCRYRGPLDPALPDEPMLSGYGIPIIAAAADRLSYRRVRTENHWQLEFERPPPATPA